MVRHRQTPRTARLRLRPDHYEGMREVQEYTSHGASQQPLTQPFTQVMEINLQKHGINTKNNPFSPKGKTNYHDASGSSGIIYTNPINSKISYHKYGEDFTVYMKLQTCVMEGQCEEIKQVALDTMLTGLCSFQWEHLFDLALKNKNLEVTKVLLGLWHKTEKNDMSKSISMVLQKAVMTDRIDFLQVYLNFSNYFIVKHATNTTLVHLAVMFNKEDILSSFIHAGVPLDMQNFQGKTALHLAVIHKSVSSVRMLLEARARWDILDNKFCLPWVYDINLFPVFQPYVETMLNTKSKDIAYFVLMACKSGSLVLLQFLQNAGAVFNFQDPFTGNTPLIEAIVHKKYETVNYLLKYHCNINVCNHKQMSAIHYILQEPFYQPVVCKTADVLVAHRASINQPYEDGTTPLIRYADCPDKFRWLLRNGANPNYIGPSGVNVLWCICKTIPRHCHLLQELLESCLDPSLINIKVTNKNKSTTPIEELLHHGELKLAKELFFESISYQHFPTLPETFKSVFRENTAESRDLEKLLSRIRRNKSSPLSLQRTCRGAILKRIRQNGYKRQFNNEVLQLPKPLTDYVDAVIFRKRQEILEDWYDLQQILDTPYYREFTYLDSDTDPYLDSD